MAEGLDRSCDPRHGGRQARRDGVEAEERTGPGLESCVPHCRTTPRRCRRLRLPNVSGDRIRWTVPKECVQASTEEVLKRVAVANKRFREVLDERAAHQARKQRR